MVDELIIAESPVDPQPTQPRPHVIVVGNEKGGTGKSTIAMHLVVALLKLGYSVGSIDLDGRQGTLSRYLANRETFRADQHGGLRMPMHRRVERSLEPDSPEKERAEFEAAWSALASCDYVVIDSPGSDSALARLGHSYADTLVTPLNDSYLDIDVIAQIDVAKREVLAPSVYTQMVWEQNNRRVIQGQPPIDWVVMRNRLSHVEAHNKRDIGVLLAKLAQRIGFRVAPGFGERVVFRELFLRGLTLIDLAEAESQNRAPQRSHLAARRELLDLLETIGVATKEPARA